MGSLLKISGCNNSQRKLDLIFVHGLDGDGKTTWCPEGNQPEDSWPAWLGEEFPDIGVWSLDYEVSSSAWKGSAMPLYERAKNTLELLNLEGLGERPIGFVCHSLGGLLTKKVLRLACGLNNPEWQPISDRTAFITFLATPHSGADMANWIQYIGLLLRKTVSIDELQKHQPQLRELNEWYRNNVESLNITTSVFYEKLPTRGILVVNETTADPGITGIYPIPLDADHITICKPQAKGGLVWLRVKKLIETCIGLPQQNATDSAGRFFQECIKRWSNPRYALDTRFVNLTLLIDQGEDAQGPRWQQQGKQYQNLEEVLQNTPEQALVLLGSPGSGKSTLLRHYELECSHKALSNVETQSPDQAPLSFFIQLNEYKPQNSNDELPPPENWLKDRWSELNPDLPELSTLLHEGRITLLLDALNEIPYQGREPIQRWKEFLHKLAISWPKIRVIFSCRSLDYSTSLSSKELPVPQVRIEPLSDPQVEEFIKVYTPKNSEPLWDNLKHSMQLDLFRTPYYLKMLVDQSADGDIPKGRAALFSGFIRQLLEREIKGENELFQAGELLKKRDLKQIIQTWEWEWKTPYKLPERGILIPKLSELAYQMQKQRNVNEAGQVRVDYDAVLEMLDHDRAEQILDAGCAMDVLVQDLGRDEVLYVHQLMQEYFAARKLAKNPEPGLVRQEWQANRVSPNLEQTLQAIADSDPLPPLPGTGWEETTLLAVAMSEDADNFISRLMEIHLDLAGSCAAQPDVSVSDGLKETLRNSLLERSQNEKADLRARIAAGLALGWLGDPRFDQNEGPYGRYLLPPFIEIPSGDYPIGSDGGLYENESPVHLVALKAFSLAQSPVTNAEWRLFIESGGYDDERWWDTEEAKSWRRGEMTSESPKQQSREKRKHYQENVDRIRELYRQDKITSKQADDWEAIVQMEDKEFEALLDKWYPSGRQIQPAFWHDDTFNNPAQPVVGICWDEAQAYCAWLRAQSGMGCRLPTEAEWEAAARGFEHRLYPYGNDFDAGRCNTFESHIRRTTPVGIFPAGEMPEGLEDMSGNVWEWTSSLFKPYHYDPDDGRENLAAGDGRRVVRGGSWGLNLVNARSAYRDHSHPDFRSDYLGFRLCCSSHIFVVLPRQGSTGLCGHSASLAGGGSRN